MSGIRLTKKSYAKVHKALSSFLLQFAPSITFLLQLVLEPRNIKELIYGDIELLTN